MNYLEVQKTVLEDLTYLNCLSLKTSILKQHSNLYAEVGSTFRSILQTDRNEKDRVSMLFLKNIFEYTANKTLSEYIESLSYHTELFNSYETIVAEVCSRYSEYETLTIETICYLVYTFDNYIGFMIEYLIAERLKAEGLSVVIDDRLDTKYKVDLLVGHPNSNTAVAIQCKSYTNKNISNEVRANTIKGLYNFKDNYKANDISCIVDLNSIENIELKFLYYDTSKGFTTDNTAILRTLEGDSLVNIDLVEGNFFSFDINQLQSTMQRKDIPLLVGIDSLVNEVKQLLGLAVEPTINALELRNKELLQQRR